MDYIKELSEVELYQSLENLLKIEKRQRAVDLNMASIAASAGSGNKDALKKVNEIVGEIRDEDRLEENRERFSKGVGELTAPLLTAEQLANLESGVK